MADPRGLLRGSAVTLVLAVLKDGARHGYDIAREVERRSENALTFAHGTLYPALHDLEADGLIVGVWEHPEGERPRRVYSLTDKGAQELDRCLRTWNSFARAVNRVIGEVPSHGEEHQQA